MGAPFMMPHERILPGPPPTWPAASEIGANVSLRSGFSEVLGFTEAEVRDMLETYRRAGVFDQDPDAVLALMREWYDGYRSAKGATRDLYRSARGRAGCRSGATTCARKRGACRVLVAAFGGEPPPASAQQQMPPMPPSAERHALVPAPAGEQHPRPLRRRAALHGSFVHVDLHAGQGPVAPQHVEKHLGGRHAVECPHTFLRTDRIDQSVLPRVFRLRRRVAGRRQPSEGRRRRAALAPQKVRAPRQGEPARWVATATSSSASLTPGAARIASTALAKTKRRGDGA